MHNEPKAGELTADEKKRIFMTLDAQTVMIQKIERGIYGDKENGVKGALKDISEIKKWIAASKVKITFISGIGVAIGFIFTRVWEWAISHK